MPIRNGQQGLFNKTNLRDPISSFDRCFSYIQVVVIEDAHKSTENILQLDTIFILPIRKSENKT